jgi:hypothetical protein
MPAPSEKLAHSLEMLRMKRPEAHQGNVPSVPVPPRRRADIRGPSYPSATARFTWTPSKRRASARTLFPLQIC